VAATATGSTFTPEPSPTPQALVKSASTAALKNENCDLMRVA
jgi:hypothetical protein